MTAIIEFRGAYRFLSNFYLTPVAYDGHVWATAEHAYQAAKTNDLLIKLMILGEPNPGTVKKIGKQIGKKDFREDWDAVRVPIMLGIVRAKFTQNVTLRQWLVATGDAELIEGNKWGDVFWGVCNGKGENNLGKILMQVRNELKP